MKVFILPAAAVLSLSAAIMLSAHFLLGLPLPFGPACRPDPPAVGRSVPGDPSALAPKSGPSLKETGLLRRGADARGEDIFTLDTARDTCYLALDTKLRYHPSLRARCRSLDGKRAVVTARGCIILGPRRHLFVLDVQPEEPPPPRPPRGAWRLPVCDHDRLRTDIKRRYGVDLAADELDDWVWEHPGYAYEGRVREAKP